MGNNTLIVSSSVGKHPDGGLYSKGPSYSGYSGYIMMPNMNNDPYMPNGSLSPPIPRTVSSLPEDFSGFLRRSHSVWPQRAFGLWQCRSRSRWKSRTP